jgi:hypothetical protein
MTLRPKTVSARVANPVNVIRVPESLTFTARSTNTLWNFFVVLTTVSIDVSESFAS